MSVQLSPGDLARELGVSGIRVRGYLRERYPGDAPGRGALWQLSAAQVREVREYFAGRGAPSARRPPVSVAACVDADSYQGAWYWEGNVQEVIVRRLRRDGWRIVSTADAGAREQGDDIRAERERSILVVEVKGYPSQTYADPRRAGETKRTNPTLQAKHWLAEAILRSMRTLGTEPDVHVAIALPEFPRYRDLAREIAGSLARLGIELMWVTESEVRRRSEGGGAE